MTTQQRMELEALAHEISDAEGYSLSLARRLAGEQQQRLLGYAVSWDAWALEARTHRVVTVRRVGQWWAIRTDGRWCWPVEFRRDGSGKVTIEGERVASADQAQAQIDLWRAYPWGSQLEAE